MFGKQNATFTENGTRHAERRIDAHTGKVYGRLRKASVRTDDVTQQFGAGLNCVIFAS